MIPASQQRLLPVGSKPKTIGTYLLIKQQPTTIKN
jgi:hypothetical protein